MRKQTVQDLQNILIFHPAYGYKHIESVEDRTIKILFDFARLLTENWENQKRLHSSVTNSQIDELFEIAQKNGTLGGKACGAGGGGCLIFYCTPDKEHLVRKKLEESRNLVLRLLILTLHLKAFLFGDATCVNKVKQRLDCVGLFERL